MINVRSKTQWLRDPRMAAAVEELRALISARYPGSTYELAAGDDPEGLYLTVIVDADDPDEVVDLFVDRLLKLQIDERLPLYVVPIRTAQRRDKRFGSPAARPANTHA
jgi:hypothetical protein